MLLSQSLVEIMRFAFMNARRFIPRDKDLLEEFGLLARDSAAKVQNFFGTADYDKRLRLATEIADEILVASALGIERHSPPQAEVE